MNAMNRSQLYNFPVSTAGGMRPSRFNLAKLHSYQADGSNTSPDILEFLPASTYVPPSPRGRLVEQHYVRPSLRLDHHMMPSPEEIMAAVSVQTRGRRSSSTSSNGSASSSSSTRSEKRRGCYFQPTANGLLDLLEREEAEFSDSSI